MRKEHSVKLKRCLLYQLFAHYNNKFTLINDRAKINKERSIVHLHICKNRAFMDEYYYLMNKLNKLINLFLLISNV